MAFEFVSAPPEFRNTLCRMFDDEFMKANTNFDNFADFKSSSAVFVNWNSDLMVYNAEILDGFVKESTKFTSWEEMVEAAFAQPTKNNRGN